MTILTFETDAAHRGPSHVGRYGRPAYRICSPQIVLLVASGLGAATVLHHLAPSPRRDAIEAVRRSGGTVSLACTESNSFNADPDVGVSGPIEVLEVFDPRIVRTSMWKTGILEHPDSLRSLRAPLVDSDLQRLRQFPHLEALGIYRGDVSDAALKHLEGMPRLRQLTINDPEISDVGIRHFRRLPQLRELILSGTRITDASMSEIGRIDSLTRLEVAGTRITDLGIELISVLSFLEELDVANTSISDDGLAHLARMPRLRRLNIEETDVTANGLRELQRRLPMCELFPTHLLKWSDAADSHAVQCSSTDASNGTTHEMPVDSR